MFTNDKVQTRSDAPRMATPRILSPSVDIYENDHELLIRADVPGVQADSVTVRFEKDQLLLAARRDPVPAIQGGADKGGAAEYQRSFIMPRGIDAEHVKASLAAGVLSIHLPKSAGSKPRLIEVKAG